MAEITTYSHGAIGKAAIATTTVGWNDGSDAAAALGAEDAIELISGWPMDEKLTAPARFFNGTTSMAGPVKVGENCSGAITTTAGFNLHQRLVALFWGTETLALLEAGATSHVFEINESQVAIHGSGGLTDNLRLREVPHFKVAGMEYSFEDGKEGEIVWDLICKRQFIDDSGTNAKATHDSGVTFPTTVPTELYLMINSSQFVVRLNVATGGALGAGDVIYPSGIKMKFQRQYELIRSIRNGIYIDEPVGSSDEVLITGEFIFNIDETAGDWAKLRDNTEYKVDVIATGSGIGATAQFYTWAWEFPSVYTDSSGLPAPDTQGLLKVTIPFKSQRSSILLGPTGMVAASAPAWSATSLRRARQYIYDELATKHMVA